MTRAMVPLLLLAVAAAVAVIVGTVLRRRSRDRDRVDLASARAALHAPERTAPRNVRVLHSTDEIIEATRRPAYGGPRRPSRHLRPARMRPAPSRSKEPQ